MPTYVLGPEAFFEGAPLGVAIAADELDIADEALELVKIEWEELPFVIDVQAALKDDAPIAYEFMESYDPETILGPQYRVPLVFR
jgi:CO/xanthine dehydrogenase Mo-binding subunit